MAFVTESPRNCVGHIKGSASGSLGPGEYHNEGQLHRMAMDAIYPKKMVPFNSQMNRGVVDKNVSLSHNQVTPGKLYIIYKPLKNMWFYSLSYTFPI